MTKFLVLISLSQLHFAYGIFPRLQRKIDANLRSGDAGEPLVLTELVRSGRYQEAQTAAEVHLDAFQDVKSYSGYFTVDETYNSNLFFWFFPSETDYKNAPVILWLQGGPGASSLFGIFTEHGPFSFKGENELEIREHRWSKNHSVLYIDNPAGTGFSFTENGYARNQTKVGEDLHEALQQFFAMFPEIQNNDFFITGESYGGKYVPAIGYTILKKKEDAKVRINLQGMAIGNGLSDPERQLRYADYLYQHGLIDLNVRNEMDDLENQFADLVRKGEYEKALELNERDFNGDSSIFSITTGLENVYNYLEAFDDSPEDLYMETFLQRADVRAAIHVGNVTFDDGQVGNLLSVDIPKPVVSWVSELLSHYRLLIYNGQLDIIVAYPMTVSYLQNLNFSAAEEYKTAPRHQWYVGDDLAGYVKYAGNLTETLVRNAGHMVPADQPAWALDLISKFVRNKPIHEDV